MPTQGTGWDVFLDVSPKGPVGFSRRALDLPFTDKGIQAYRLERSTSALGQSAVRRHTRASCIIVVDVVDVDDDDEGCLCIYFSQLLPFLLSLYPLLFFINPFSIFFFIMTTIN